VAGGISINDDVAGGISINDDVAGGIIGRNTVSASWDMKRVGLTVRAQQAQQGNVQR
jgi:hypothetical protein